MVTFLAYACRACGFNRIYGTAPLFPREKVDPLLFCPMCKSNQRFVFAGTRFRQRQEEADYKAALRRYVENWTIY